MTFDKWFQQQREDTDLFGAKCTGLESLVYLAMKRAWEASQVHNKQDDKDYDI